MKTVGDQVVLDEADNLMYNIYIYIILYFNKREI